VDVNRGAPVMAEGEIEIATSPERAWDLMAAIEAWPSWNPDVRSATLSGPLSKGTVFRWKAGPGTITSTLQAVERPSLLAWTGTTFGIRAVHVWRFERRGSSTLASSAESWEGLLAGMFRGRMQRQLDRSNQDGLERLKGHLEG
jgi:hypothetical protein